MLRLSEAISRVKPSPTIVAANRADALRAQGRDIISLTVGEPDFDTPDHIKAAATEALKKGYTKYTAVGGIAPLKKVICEKFERDQGLKYAPNETIVTNGGKQALYAACVSLLNPGEEAIIPAPYWTSYPDFVLLAGGTPVIVPTTPESGYLMTPESLQRALSPHTRVLFINSPSNPSGACYSREDLQALVNVVKESGYLDQITIISDEVYEYITFDGFEHVSIAQVAPELRDNLLLVNAFSKAYSMTGWRVGYAAGPKSVIDAMTTLQSQATTNVCSIAQHAAAAAYSDNYAFPKMMAREFSKRRELVINAVKNMPGIRLAANPRGAFFFFLRVEDLFGKKHANGEIKTALDFTMYLLEHYDLAVVQGEAFGDPGAIRISFALSSEKLQQGLDRMRKAVASLT